MVARAAAILLLGFAALASAPCAGETAPAPAKAGTEPPQTISGGVAKPPAASVVDGQEVEGILGKDVQSRKGEKMGEIIDVIVDPKGHVRAALVDFGGFLGVGSRKLAVDWRAVHFVPGDKSFRVVVDLTKDELAGAPAYQAGKRTVILETPAPGPPSLPDPGKPPSP